MVVLTGGIAAVRLSKQRLRFLRKLWYVSPESASVASSPIVVSL